MKKTYKILFIVNPFAGISKKRNFPKMVEKHFEKPNADYKIVYTEYAGHAKELAAKGVAEGADIIAAVGGDGTVNEVGGALVDSKTALAIIPGGSGNGLSMHLGIGRNAGKALSLLKNPDFETIDTCKINNDFFINMAGIGIDAQVAHRTSQNNHRGFVNYLFDTLKIVLSYKNERYLVEVDDKVKEGRFLSVNIANGSMFGYNFVVAPQASVHDGNLQLVLMHHAPKWKYLLHSWRFFAKNIDRAPFAEILKAKKIKIQIQSDHSLVYHKDGDGLCRDTKELNVEVIPNSLLVAVPKR
ncbi:MAG: diacylglycerol kinase family protein [Saprospiraceae bacterium]